MQSLPSPPASGHAGRRRRGRGRGRSEGQQVPSQRVAPRALLALDDAPAGVGLPRIEVKVEYGVAELMITPIRGWPAEPASPR
jgi:hypothetical protein